MPVAYKAMCGIVQGRLAQVVGERNLVAEEHGGFRKGRGCKNQLLGQVRAPSKTECLLVSLILRRLMMEWTVTEGSCGKNGIGGQVTAFLKAEYTDASCEVKVVE